MKRLVCGLIAAMTLTACTSVGEGPQRVETAPTSADHEFKTVEPVAMRGDDDVPPRQEPTADPSIDFFDAKGFDKQLSAALRQDPPAVKVTFLTPTTVNDIPERLGAWLNLVEKYDGTVKLEAEPEARKRGLFTGAITLVVVAFTGLYQAVANKILYGPVQDYHAIIYHKPGDGTITRVVFTRKARNPEAPSFNADDS